VRCFACGHRCLVKPGRRGICKVRFNKDGVLLVPAGYVAPCSATPPRRNPFFHCLPGSDTLTFGMLVCDFHCGYCQNWLTSQALRDETQGCCRPTSRPTTWCGSPTARAPAWSDRPTTSRSLRPSGGRGVQDGARGGLKTAFISNGNATPEVLDFIRPWTDCYKID